jgi:hypothetical protein
MFPIFCAICNSEEKSLWDLGNHISTKHTRNNTFRFPAPKKVQKFVKNLDQTSGMISGQTSGMISGQTSGMISGQTSDTTTVKESSLTCQHCQKTFWQKSALLRHVRNAHLLENRFQCAHCPKSFKENWKRSKHVRENHKEDLEGKDKEYDDVEALEVSTDFASLEDDVVQTEEVLTHCPVLNQSPEKVLSHPSLPVKPILQSNINKQENPDNLLQAQNNSVSSEKVLSHSPLPAKQILQSKINKQDKPANLIQVLNNSESPEKMLSHPPLPVKMALQPKDEKTILFGKVHPCANKSGVRKGKSTLKLNTNDHNNKTAKQSKIPKMVNYKQETEMVKQLPIMFGSPNQRFAFGTEISITRLPSGNNSTNQKIENFASSKPIQETPKMKNQSSQNSAGNHIQHSPKMKNQSIQNFGRKQIQHSTKMSTHLFNKNSLINTTLKTDEINSNKAESKLKLGPKSLTKTDSSKLIKPSKSQVKCTKCFTFFPTIVQMVQHVRVFHQN